jgi:Fe-S cluster assembly protein SufD
MTTMTTTVPQAAFSEEGFEAFLHGRDEPQWLTEQRRAAWQTYCDLSWPDRRHEEWIRTDIRAFKLDQYAPPAASGEASPLPEAQLGEGVALAGFSATLNSQPAETRLDAKWSAQGVLFGSLDQLVAEHGDLIQRHLMRRAVDPAYDKFAALHAAFWSGGHLLYVPRGVAVDQPLLALSALADGGVDFGHTLIILEDGAEATMMSESASCSPTEAACTAERWRCCWAEAPICDTSTCRIGAAASGISPTRKRSSAKTPRCNGRSERWAAACAKSTSTSG